MRIAIAFLTLTILAMPELNTAEPIPISSVLMYSININRINSMGAAPGNSNEAAIDVTVTQLGDSICGLNADNFRMHTLKAPTYGSDIVICSVGISYASSWGNHASCNCSINMAPTSNQGKQYPWEEGDYTLQLDYINNGGKLASETFNLTVIRNLSDSAVIDNDKTFLIPY